MADTQPKFTFQYLSGKKFPSLEGKEENEFYLKWSIKGRMSAQTFSFDQHFQVYQKDEFALAFFQDPQVLQNLKVVQPSGSWTTLGTKAASVTVEPLETTQMSMAFFDRLTENEVVRESGAIKRCYDEYYEDMLISNELRKLLVMEDSDYYGLFDESDRKELLFCIFQFLCLGGLVNQFEDDVTEYLNITKKIYKDLLSVQKSPDTGELRILSNAFKVTAHDDSGRPYYPTDSDLPRDQDFAYLIVDPLKRHATIFYHKFGATVS